MLRHRLILTTASVEKMDKNVRFYAVTYFRRRILWFRDRRGHLYFSFVLSCPSEKWVNMPSSILND